MKNSFSISRIRMVGSFGLIMTIITIMIILISTLVDSYGGRRSCGMNAYWNECATSCPDNCYNYGRPRPCTLNCRQACSCKRGFVFESSGLSGRCVPISYCHRNNNNNGRWNNNNNGGGWRGNWNRNSFQRNQWRYYG
uniref:Chymotrypsin inhibitor Ani s 6-like n=1 Tax=Dermatophagoides pteronyssinus TaxID=6956 RepID=A0A6P6YHL0_DERPT|nr:chymotrypsin inhibitor Ani s 6-like [Dermatophagoides pteronyssinus]